MSDLSAAEVIELLDLKPHPEGGHFRETFRDRLEISNTRAASSAIYFLLARGPRGAAFTSFREASQACIPRHSGAFCADSWKQEQSRRSSALLPRRFPEAGSLHEARQQDGRRARPAGR
jgi:predicted cupin superfamily sugar epimerase